MLFQVLVKGKFTTEVLQSEKVEGTPQFCVGYEKALRTFFPDHTLVVTEICDDYEKRKRYERNF